MNEIWKVLRDPRVSTTLILAGMVAVGFGLIAQGYRGAAALLFVPYQMPFAVSGAVVGVGLVGAGLALLTVHLERSEAAQERCEVAALQRDVLRLLAVAPLLRRSRDGLGAGPSRARPGLVELVEHDLQHAPTVTHR
jgi:hypothetical protein